MRILYGQGAHGGVVESIQRRLTSLGHDTKGFDGFYGKNTTSAVESFQAAKPLPVTGTVDDVTWQAVMGTAIPAVEVRSLELTAAFEGHGYTLAQGNWDGAWLTWGIIGFTMKHGEVQKIILEVQATFPDLLGKAFGDSAPRLLEVMRDSSRNQEAWAISISSGSRVVEPWVTGFRLLGQSPQVQDIQRRLARADYYVPAQNTAQQWGLKSELGLALCFDIHVQNGGIKAQAADAINAAVGANRPNDERALREIIARAVADASATQFQDDVLSRKMTIAHGQGTVHGGNYALMNWGLGDFPVA